MAQNLQEQLQEEQEQYDHTLKVEVKSVDHQRHPDTHVRLPESEVDKVQNLENVRYPQQQEPKYHLLLIIWQTVPQVTLSKPMEQEGCLVI